jgi:hypothetical protein
MTTSTRSGNSIDGAGVLRSAIFATVVLALAAALSACGGGSDDDVATALGSTGLQRSADASAEPSTERLTGEAAAPQPAQAQ